MRFGSRPFERRLPSCFALVVAALLVACESKPPETEAAPATTKSSATTPQRAELRKVGAPLTLDSTTNLADLLAFPEPLAGKIVQVEGEVRRACSKKGCWMEVATSREPNAPGCRVTFKDYAFFVPLDAAGSHARVEGLVEVKELTKARVDHLEAEGARFEDKAPDGTAQEVRIVATGVELKRG